jgi:pyroglutamyl-peptidase
MTMRLTILITGFGPFPGAPFNPTEMLVRRLARERRPALASIKIVPHIFRTSYAAVDRDLPALLQVHKPDAILMFGLAARTKHLRVETLARNAVAGASDVDRHTPNMRVLDRGKPSTRALPTPARHLLASARTAHVPAALSRDAGRYLCNYLCWRATEATHANGGPQLAAFIHVPLVRRGKIPSARAIERRVTIDDLVRTARRFLTVIASAAQR